jgi:hypothetical protein
MPRTTLTKTTVKGPFPTLPVAAGGLDVVMTAADVANKNQFVPSGNDLVIMQNSGASPYTVTLTSAPDAQNRTGDVTTYSLDPNDVCTFLVKGNGWVQGDGNVYLEASNAAVKFGIVAL